MDAGMRMQSAFWISVIEVFKDKILKNFPESFSSSQVKYGVISGQIWTEVKSEVNKKATRARVTNSSAHLWCRESLLALALNP